MAALETDSDIGLLSADIIMPGGMSGIELAVETRRRWPGLGILMTSGFPGHLRPGCSAGWNSTYAQAVYPGGTGSCRSKVTVGRANAMEQIRL